MEKRFQECNWLEKLWRYRFYLYVPFKFCWIIFNYKVSELSNKMIFRILIGEAQCDMKWYYTSDEVDKFIEEKMNKK